MLRIGDISQTVLNKTEKSTKTAVGSANFNESLAALSRECRIKVETGINSGLVDFNKSRIEFLDTLEGWDEEDEIKAFLAKIKRILADKNKKRGGE